jgi:hypothetical protein
MSLVSTRSTVALAALATVFVAAPDAGAKKPPTVPAAVAPVVGPVLHPAADACGYVGSRIFAAWHDRRGYALTPDGGFENGAEGWSLAGGAAVAEGNETFQLGGPADHRSLSLPAGSSATSPPVCVAKHDGIFRLLARGNGSKARLKVEVTYFGKGQHGKRSVLYGKGAWAPTRKLAVALGRAKKGKLATAMIAIRFTPLSGTWDIDGLYIDPRLRT